MKSFNYKKNIVLLLFVFFLFIILLNSCDYFVIMGHYVDLLFPNDGYIAKNSNINIIININYLEILNTRIINGCKVFFSGYEDISFDYVLSYVGTHVFSYNIPPEIQNGERILFFQFYDNKNCPVILISRKITLSR